ncbi:hypothetical protein COV18_01520 [Candidatus Woesearchaeota archaeon CG10_big_fil_rev_8_21_14_0_10_37_12]|nr:MAG: hypothetical protein COV18_01520 [Candidatus Woesearchaeota archaeon CG10_big_fil_rev_8_21_14_0_10_37_12]
MVDDVFYVGINESTELRRELLTNSKKLLISLKQYEKYSRISEEKIQKIRDLKHVYDELTVLNKKIRGKLPNVPVKTPEQSKQFTVSSKQSEPIKREPKTKIDVLEDELDKIESKLQGLE